MSASITAHLDVPWLPHVSTCKPQLFFEFVSVKPFQALFDKFILCVCFFFSINFIKSTRCTDILHYKSNNSNTHTHKHAHPRTPFETFLEWKPRILVFLSLSELVSDRTQIRNHRGSQNSLLFPHSRFRSCSSIASFVLLILCSRVCFTSFVVFSLYFKFVSF